jgi:Peptidase family M23
VGLPVRGFTFAAAWLGLTWLSPSRAHGQDSLPGGPDSLLSVIVSSTPSPLAEGTLGWLGVRPSHGATLIQGEAGGEPIQFELLSDSSYRALVGVPIGRKDSLGISLLLQRVDHVDTVKAWIPLKQGGYSREVLAVAPAFIRPDRAAAARIRADIARSRMVSRLSRQRPRLWRGPFQLPRTSRITSPFGTARVFNGEVRSRHLGTDFAGAVGAPVLSSGRGVVALVADFYLAGRSVYVDHGAGLVTAYFHLSKAYVTQGDTVEGGQRIGAVGRSGRVTGPHLHWVARYGAISVNPMSLMDLEQAPTPAAPPGPVAPADTSSSRAERGS